MSPPRTPLASGWYGSLCGLAMEDKLMVYLGNAVVILFFVLALLGLMALIYSLWILWNKTGLYPADDSRADTTQDPVYIDRDRIKWYPERTDC